MNERHGLEPCKECGIWHCPVCGCRAVDVPPFRPTYQAA